MDIRVSVQAMYYIAKALNKPVDKLTLLKLVFFADRYHLRKYARTITDDTYFALKYGPVASNTKDILDDLADTSQQDEVYANQFLNMVDTKTFSAKDTSAELDFLSETDIEALDFVITNFGQMSSYKLVDLTHEYPEWKRFEQSLQSGMKRERIRMEDFFEDPRLEDDKFSVIPSSLVHMSKEIYLHG